MPEKPSGTDGAENGISKYALLKFPDAYLPGPIDCGFCGEHVPVWQTDKSVNGAACGKCMKVLGIEHEHQ